MTMLLNGFLITIGVALALAVVLIAVVIITALYAIFDISRDYKKRRKEIENGQQINV